MVCVFFPGVFYAEIIYDQRERDGMRFVIPKSRRVLVLKIPMWF